MFRARHEELGREVALKLLHGELTEDRRQRFAREGVALARIQHPHVVRVFEAGEVVGVPYLALELVSGESLAERLQRGLLSASEAARLGRDLADALAACHALGVLHRDLKPDNVLIEADDQARLTDFGLVKDLSRLEQTRELTQTGQLMGTPGYWAPEQVRGTGSPLDPRVDVYGLGATLYCCMTGQGPHEGLGAFEAAVAAMELDPRPASDLCPGIPPAFEAILSRCLARDPEDRYPSAEALRDDLDRFLAGGWSQAEGDRAARRARRWAAGAGLLVFLGALGAALLPRAPRPAAPSAAPSRSPAPPGTPAPELPPLAGPQGWRAAWSLATGSAAERDARWTAPRRVEPLRREPAALVESYLGQVEALEDGRLIVDYFAGPSSLPRSGLRWRGHEAFAGLVTRGVPQMGQWEEHSGSWRVLAPNDVTALLLHPRARWGGVQIEVDLDAQRIDRGDLALMWGPRKLALSQRAKLVTLSAPGRDYARTLLTQSVRRQLQWTPGASLSIDGEPGQTLKGPGGSASLRVWVSEGVFNFRALRVSGVPRSVDRPALAWAPVATAPQLALALDFELEEGPELGGPVLAIGDPCRPTGLVLELEREEAQCSLQLRRGSRILSRVQVEPQQQGVLRLVRRSDWVEGTLRVGQRRWSVGAPLVLPCSGERAGFGSSGAPLRVRRAALWLGEDDPGRAAWDRGEAPAVATGERARWRVAAREVLGLSEPDLFAEVPDFYRDASYRVGRGGVTRAKEEQLYQQRVAFARRLGHELLELAHKSDLPLDLARDAMARALLAVVYAGDAQAAESVARSLAARKDGVERLNWVAWDGMTLEGLARGLRVMVTCPTTAEAALEAARVLTPREEQGKLLFGLARVTWLRVDPNPGLLRTGLDRDSIDREDVLRRALVLLHEAKELGYFPREANELELQIYREQRQVLRYLASLGTFLRHKLSRTKVYSWIGPPKDLDQLGQHTRALEISLGVLVFMGPTPERVQGVLARVRRAEVAPGSKALALLLVAVRAAKILDPAGVAKLREQARYFAAAALSGRDPRQHDLARYVLRRLELGVPAARPGERPTCALLEDDPARLREAMGKDILIELLAEEDPRLVELSER